MAEVFVELARGYGSGYGVVIVGDDGSIPVVNDKCDGWYKDEKGERVSRMPRDVQALLSSPRVQVNGVMVPSGAITRVIGPLDCPEAKRIRLRLRQRNRSNPLSRDAIDQMTDAEVAAMID